jgi:hypothetical protein
MSTGMIIKWTFFKKDPYVLSEKLHPNSYYILFYFLGNKRGMGFKKSGAITSQKKNLITIVSHLLFWATNFPSTYSMT